jgi:PST family polysaccharide transporter
MSLAASAARGGAITVGSQLIKVVLMLSSTVVLARLLSPHDYGVVAMVVAVIGVGEIFRDFGLSMAALQAKELTRAQQSNLFWINAGVGLTLAVLCFGTSFLLASFYGQPEVAGIAQALSATFLLNGLSTQFKVVINRALRFFHLALVDLLPYIGAFVAALVVAITTGSYWALVLQQLVTAAMTLLLAVGFARWWPGLPSRAPMRHLLSFGVSFAITQLLSYATRNVDSIAIGRVWGSTTVGFYDRAYSLLVMPLTQINTPMTRVAVPVLSRIQDEKDRFVSYLRRAQLVALYVTSTMFCLLVALAVPLVVLVLGEEWRRAGELLAVLAIGGIFRSLQQISYWIYMSLGLAKVQLRFYLVAQPLLVLIIIAGVPWGAMGVAVAHGIAYGLFWVASVLWAIRATKLPLGVLFVDALRSVGLIGVPVAALSWLASWLSVDYGPLLQVLAGLAATVVWVAFAYFAIPFIRQDLQKLAGFAKLALGRGKK